MSQLSDEEAAQIIQRCFRNYSTDVLELIHERREHTVRELVSNEKLYVSNIASACALYRQPMIDQIKDGKEIISEDKIEQIFQNILDIVSVHSEMSGSFQKRIKKWSKTQTIGDCILEYCKALNVYTTYTLGFCDAVDTLKAARSKIAFRSFIRAQVASDLNKMVQLTLEDLLIMPVHRIPRYELMIDSILKFTRPCHPDYKLLQEALLNIRGLAVDINNRKQGLEEKHQEAMLIYQLENCDIPSNPERTLVYQQDVVEFYRAEKKAGSRKRRRLFLFNDLLLCAREKITVASDLGSTSYSLKWCMALNDVKVHDGWEIGSTWWNTALECIAEKLAAVTEKNPYNNSNNNHLALSPSSSANFIDENSDGFSVHNSNGVRSQQELAVNAKGISGRSISVGENSIDSFASLPDMSAHSPDANNGQRRSTMDDLASSLASLDGSLTTSSTKGNTLKKKKFNWIRRSSPVPDQNAFAGHDVVVWIADALDCSISDAVLYCQELLDLDYMGQFSVESSLFRSGTTLYRLLNQTHNPDFDPITVLDEDIEEMTQSITMEQRIAEAVNKIEHASKHRSYKSFARKEKNSSGKTLGAMRKSLDHLMQQRDMYGAKECFHVVASPHDGQPLITTFFVAQPKEKEAWFKQVNKQVHGTKHSSSLDLEVMYMFNGLRGAARPVRSRGIRMSSFSGDNSSVGSGRSRHGTFSTHTNSNPSSPAGSPSTSRRSSRMRRWTGTWSEKKKSRQSLMQSDDDGKKSKEA